MKAILVGATGLVGSEILKLLLSDPRFLEVRVLTRRSIGFSHPKLHEKLVDFEDPSSWIKEIQGDVLFSALGTTIKQAGSQKAQYHVDHDYQLLVATAAKTNGVRCLILVSSGGARKSSKIFYLRMKGEIEDQLTDLQFETTYFIRPSPIEGERNRSLGLGVKALFFALNYLPKIHATKNFWPIKGSEVAQICVGAAVESKKGVYVLEPKQIFSRLKSNNN